MKAFYTDRHIILRNLLKRVDGTASFAATIRWMDSVFCGAPDAVIPLPHDPVEACGRNPIAVFDETSQPKSGLTESLYIRFVNDFKDDYLVREYDRGDFRQRYATGVTAAQDSAPSFFSLDRTDSISLRVSVNERRSSPPERPAFL